VAVFTSPNSLIIIGTLLIAVGGMVATYGWNQQSEQAKRVALIRAVAAETMANASVIQSPEVSEHGDKFVVLPRTRTIAIDAAIASGLFNTESDRPFFTRASRMSNYLHAFNRALTSTEQQMMEHSKDVPMWRKKLSEGEVLDQIRKETIAFMEFLIGDCGIKESDEFYDHIEGDRLPPWSKTPDSAANSQANVTAPNSTTPQPPHTNQNGSDRNNKRGPKNRSGKR
jgi:hypothetical protein